MFPAFDVLFGSHANLPFTIPGGTLLGSPSRLLLFLAFGLNFGRRDDHVAFFLAEPPHLGEIVGFNHRKIKEAEKALSDEFFGEVSGDSGDHRKRFG